MHACQDALNYYPAVNFEINTKQLFYREYNPALW